MVLHSSLRALSSSLLNIYEVSQIAIGKLAFETFSVLKQNVFVDGQLVAGHEDSSVPGRESYLRKTRKFPHWKSGQSFQNVGAAECASSLTSLQGMLSNKRNK